MQRNFKLNMLHRATLNHHFFVQFPRYESCCWINVVSPDTGSGARGWNMQTDIDVTPRSDRDGKINSSPVTAAIPTEKYRLGCTYDLKIAGQSERKSIICFVVSICIFYKVRINDVTQFQGFHRILQSHQTLPID